MSIQEYNPKYHKKNKTKNTQPRVLMSDNDINQYKVIAYIGESHNGSCPLEMEYNPYENAVIYRDNIDDGHELGIDPECLEEMAEQIKEFALKIKPINKPH